METRADAAHAHRVPLVRVEGVRIADVEHAVVALRRTLEHALDAAVLERERQRRLLARRRQREQQAVTQASAKAQRDVLGRRSSLAAAERELDALRAVEAERGRRSLAPRAHERRRLAVAVSARETQFAFALVLTTWRDAACRGGRRNGRRRR